MLLALGACSEATDDSPEATDEIVQNLRTAGFPASEIEVREDRTVWVGGDAVVGLDASRELAGVRVDAPDEFRQYRTTNLIDSTIATICVSAVGWTGNMSTALDSAISNYNILNLSFNMRRTTGNPSGCDAVITANAVPGTGGSAGFPSNGDPYHEINIGTGIGSLANLTQVTTHELGHTIGFRHTDFYNRTISCGIGGDEGQSDSGAHHIPNTPTTAVLNGSVMNACYNSGSTGAWTIGDVSANNELYGTEFFEAVGYWSADYGYNAGGWRVEYHPRFIADVNADGRDDIIGFGNAGAYVSLSTGSAFSSPSLWTANYGYYAGGWRVEYHPRMMADVNGDRRQDIVGFGNAGAYVSLSTGSSFSSPVLWVANYGYDAGGWRVERHPRIMADVNADGRDDIVGFGDGGTYVSLSTGSSFTTPSLWVADYGYTAGGWRNEYHPRMLSDVNGDGRDDVVGFGNGGAYVSLSTGSSFSSPVQWSNNYGYNAGGWRVERHPRTLADMNADGRADVVGFGDAGVYVSLSSGSAFGAPSLWVADYGYVAGGWRVDRNPRIVTDIDGDARADIVGFGNPGTFVSKSTGSGFNGIQMWIGDFAYDLGGWRVSQHPRFMGDVTGDGLKDIVGFGNPGTFVGRYRP